MSPLSLVSSKAVLQLQYLWILKHKPLTAALRWLASYTHLKKIRDLVCEPCGYMVQLLRKDEKQHCPQAFSHRRATELVWPFGDVHWGALSLRSLVPCQHFLATRRGKEGGGLPTPPHRQQGQAPSLWRSFLPLPYFSGDRSWDKYHSSQNRWLLVLCTGRLVCAQLLWLHLLCIPFMNVSSIMSHSLQASKASAPFLHPEEMVFVFFSRPLGGCRSHMQTSGLFLSFGHRLTILTFANKQ